jgi:hypothetical protein
MPAYINGDFIWIGSSETEIEFETQTEEEKYTEEVYDEIIRTLISKGMW